MSADELKSQVKEWLKSLGCEPTAVSDQGTEWHFVFQYPPQAPHQMHVVCPKGVSPRVVIATGIEVSGEHLKGFEGLDEGSREEFLYELRKAINNFEVDFQVDGLKEPNDCPTRIGLSTVRYQDGLSLDNFARSVGAVYKTELATIWVVQRFLGNGGFQAGGRFDFRRLGL